jgi:hypothetical protein
VREALDATVASELWPGVAKEVVTGKQVAEGCAWGLFKSLQLRVRVVGAWRAHAPEELREDLRDQQAVGNYTVGLVKEWWTKLVWTEVWTKLGPLVCGWVGWPEFA